MCWVSKKQDIKIAEQNIPIFKIMKKTPFPEIVKSIYQNFSYTLNSLVKSNIKIQLWRSIDNIVVDQALHSYNPEKVKCSSNSSTLKIKVPTSYSFKELDSFDKNEDIIKVKGIIPKGSKYMENRDGEFVSNQLILTEICAGLEN